MAKSLFMPGGEFVSDGPYRLKATAMVRRNSEFLDRYLVDEAGRKVCSGCDGTSREVNDCLANVITIETRRSEDGYVIRVAKVSHQCAVNALGRLAQMMQDGD